MFNIISARQIQREYKKILEKANKTKEPIIVVSHNKPQGAIIGLDLLERLQLELLLKRSLKEPKKIIRTKEDLEKDL